MFKKNGNFGDTFGNARGGFGDKKGMNESSDFDGSEFDRSDHLELKSTSKGTLLKMEQGLKKRADAEIKKEKVKQTREILTGGFGNPNPLYKSSISDIVDEKDKDALYKASFSRHPPG
jgi:hypothetical protein